MVTGATRKTQYSPKRAKSSAPNTLQLASGCNYTREPTPSRPAEEGPGRRPGVRRAGMTKVPTFRPDLDAASPRGQIPHSRVPDADPATLSPLHYLRLIVISGIRHGYGAPEARGRERKQYSAPAWPDRKSRPAQPAGKPFRGRRELL